MEKDKGRDVICNHLIRERDNVSVFVVNKPFMKFILGKKLNMDQVFLPDGKVAPVTVVQAGPCQVTQVKSMEKDGYQAVQIGWQEKKRLSKPLLGHLKSLPKFRHLKEFRIDESQELARGQRLTVGIFEIGDKVKVTGVSKGRGFQGVVKRHGFHGSPASHGHKDQLRMPGSIGSTDAARVFKGKRMAGRMGTDQVTVNNLEVIKIDQENNLIYLKGALPGARNGLILIQATGEIKEVVKEEPKKEEAPQVEESKEVISKETEAAVEETKTEVPAEDVKAQEEKKDEAPKEEVKAEQTEEKK